MMLISWVAHTPRALMVMVLLQSSKNFVHNLIATSLALRLSLNPHALGLAQAQLEYRTTQ